MVSQILCVFLDRNTHGFFSSTLLSQTVSKTRTSGRKRSNSVDLLKVSTLRQHPRHHVYNVLRQCFQTLKQYLCSSSNVCHLSRSLVALDYLIILEHFLFLDLYSDAILLLWKYPILQGICINSLERMKPSMSCFKCLLNKLVSHALDSSCPNSLLLRFVPVPEDRVFDTNELEKETSNIASSFGVSKLTFLDTIQYLVSRESPSVSNMQSVAIYLCLKMHLEEESLNDLSKVLIQAAFAQNKKSFSLISDLVFWLYWFGGFSFENLLFFFWKPVLEHVTKSRFSPQDQNDMTYLFLAHCGFPSDNLDESSPQQLCISSNRFAQCIRELLPRILTLLDSEHRKSLIKSSWFQELAYSSEQGFFDLYRDCLQLGVSKTLFHQWMNDLCSEDNLSLKLKDVKASDLEQVLTRMTLMVSGNSLTFEKFSHLLSQLDPFLPEALLKNILFIPTTEFPIKMLELVSETCAHAQKSIHDPHSLSEVMWDVFSFHPQIFVEIIVHHDSERFGRECAPKIQELFATLLSNSSRFSQMFTDNLHQVGDNEIVPFRSLHLIGLLVLKNIKCCETILTSFDSIEVAETDVFHICKILCSAPVQLSCSFTDHPVFENSFNLLRIALQSHCKHLSETLRQELEWKIFVQRFHSFS